MPLFLYQSPYSNSSTSIFEYKQKTRGRAKLNFFLSYFILQFSITMSTDFFDLTFCCSIFGKSSEFMPSMHFLFSFFFWSPKKVEWKKILFFDSPRTSIRWKAICEIPPPRCWRLNSHRSRRTPRWVEGYARGQEKPFGWTRRHFYTKKFFLSSGADLMVRHNGGRNKNSVENSVKKEEEGEVLTLSLPNVCLVGNLRRL